MNQEYPESFEEEQDSIRYFAKEYYEHGKVFYNAATPRGGFGNQENPGTLGSSLKSYFQRNKHMPLLNGPQENILNKKNSDSLGNYILREFSAEEEKAFKNSLEGLA